MAGPIPPAQPPPEAQDPHQPDPHPHPHSHARARLLPRPRPLLWRLRRNPLRRRTDLVQAWIAVGLFLVVLTATPAAVVLVGDAVRRHTEQIARHQADTRHRTTAVLVHDAPRHPEPGSVESRNVQYPVTVRFTDRHGDTRTAQKDVEPALPAGSAIRVWVSDEGKLTGPPLTDDEVRDHTVGYAVMAAIAVPLLGAAAYACAHRRLERINLARWDADWAAAKKL
ncbi:Rv1733c family protein [Streptomyces sp. NPDC055099]